MLQFNLPEPEPILPMRHSLRTALMLLSLLTCAPAFCAPLGEAGSMPDSAPPGSDDPAQPAGSAREVAPPVAVPPQADNATQSDEDRAIAAVHQAIRRHQLSALDDHCLAYDFDDATDEDYFIVDVRENSGDGQCGGDPDTSLHLFRFKIERSSFNLLTDAGSDDGTFYFIEP